MPAPPREASRRSSCACRPTGRRRAAPSCSPTTWRWAPAPSTRRRRCARSGRGPGRRPTSSPRAAPPTGATATARTAGSTTTSTRCIIKPSPPDLQDIYLGSLAAIGIDMRAARHPLRGGRLGEPDARRLGPRLGGLVRRHGGQPVHLLPAGRRPRLPPGLGRAHLRPRAAGDVRARLRRRQPDAVQRPRQRRSRSPTATSSARPRRSTPAGTSTWPTPPCCSATSRTPRRNAPASSPSRTWTRGPAGASSWRCPPTTSASRPATSSTCSTPAASSPSPSGRPTSAASGRWPRPAPTPSCAPAQA